MAELHDIHRRLETHSELLLHDGDAYSDAIRAAADARNAYDVKKAQQTLVVRATKEFAGFTVAEKSAQVTELCREEMIAARIAEAMADGLKTRLRAVEASLSAVQSQARLALADQTLDKWRT